MKNQKGVTIVALVVTIIVLIILAGLSIKLLLGDNGIIEIAKKAKENTELAKIEEEKDLNELYDQLSIESSNSGKLTILCSVSNSYSTSTQTIDLKTLITNYQNYNVDNFIIIPKGVGYYCKAYSGAGSSAYNLYNGTSEITKTYDNSTGILMVEGLQAYKIVRDNFFYYGYITEFDVAIIN